MRESDEIGVWVWTSVWVWITKSAKDKKRKTGNNDASDMRENVRKRKGESEK